MMAHVQGTGDLAYPKQDEADIRATAVRNAFDRLTDHIGRVNHAHDRYTSAAIRGDVEMQRSTRGELQRSSFELGRVLRETEGMILTALEEAGVRAVHDKGGE